MSGSIPGGGTALNLAGSGGSTLGAAQRGTGVDAVTGSDNKLQAFDPATMASATAPKPAAEPGGVAAGMTASGIPTYISNWLSGGMQGAAPTGSETFASLTKPPDSTVNTGLDPASISTKTTHFGDPWKPKQVAKPVAAAGGGVAWPPVSGPVRTTAAGATTSIPQNHPFAPDYNPGLPGAPGANWNEKDAPASHYAGQGAPGTSLR